MPIRLPPHETGRPALGYRASLGIGDRGTELAAVALVALGMGGTVVAYRATLGEGSSVCYMPTLRGGDHLAATGFDAHCGQGRGHAFARFLAHLGPTLSAVMLTHNLDPLS